MSQPSVDLDRLFKLRLVVARFGEMDIAQWWNTKGQLGRTGALALRRGFPRTHHFAQARSVFAVAAHRCSELFDPPGCVTLWRLPESIEDELDTRWEHWLDDTAAWAPFFQRVEALRGIDPTGLEQTLRSFGITSDRDAEAFAKLRRPAGGRSVQLPGVFSGTDHEITLLALGFAHGQPGSPVVPYARRSDA